MAFLVVSHRHARGERRDRGRARAWTTPTATFVAGNDAPLIGERAGTRGGCAMEGGDECDAHYPFELDVGGSCGAALPEEPG